MLFKFIFSLLKQLRWIISIVLVVGGITLVALQYQQIKSSPFGSFLPNISLASLKNMLPTPVTPTVTAIPTPNPNPTMAIVSIQTPHGPVVFTSEVAQTDETRALGLMYRTQLDPYAGMYFIFKDDVQGGFWMKNCEIPLDLIFIDSENKIIDIRANVPPCKQLDPTQTTCPSYVPKAPYRTVLEVNGGTAKANNFSVGLTVTVLDK
ncbi:hypothetical protein CO112_00530 [Candidatus Dojkabacteria bacterium CG_4_9_14_3_um_filter_150_Dojkabacteria_WS6_41_13]|uniref:DUF192 domain-containing protein n=1 Tax=Candidatus Dojkabacteria bacterium CG_4_10_14_0_2_um_filter_Dojkabacteria_WS6_41_15 TaxID=2014249 RepID=A0A2M7W436_9BACT|nr:MAG: hypothetical protein COZ14_02685 [Candidatus Dojkabacteria bacterium CG_4_10_14_3_um_filter_Dojkabacteria_WS6_41_9]PJA15967.1 MAG: hypothetical protein COX64_00040 [Candidatus Dojkabacteria bacterium CG_4_10_14_0_2_um_filter_Dojkabacteria_WS6_41_15]PJB23578.1 MAG: hypothetical protein CO112_00530 [Candidatus Dojkabacteria bacterium CG_4_9_14_3_um_filter_150_Dojkabacteria_WS6_41_13]